MTESIRLRVPLSRVANSGGLNQGSDHIDVPVIIDPELGPRGETRRDHGYATTDTSIVLREWNEQVLLHELLHVLLDGRVPTTPADPHGHEAISRVEVGLWETGWRMSNSPGLSAGEESRG